jgi:putative transposase
MAHLARVVVPGLQHHVTQRGNWRRETFNGEDDYRAARALMAASLRKAGVACWACCLMPNHVHLILTPALRIHGLASTVGTASGLIPTFGTLGFVRQ